MCLRSKKIKTIFEYISLYFSDEKHLKKIKEKVFYNRTLRRIMAVQTSENITKQAALVGSQARKNGRA